MVDSRLEEPLSADELRDVWPILTAADRVDGFRCLDQDSADAFFPGLSPREQAEIVAQLPQRERRAWLRTLAPDDAADVLQEVTPEERGGLLQHFDEPMRRELTALLAYAEDDAGGLMSPRFARIRADMKVEEAIRYVRRQALQNIETIHYAYVLDGQQRLVGVVSLRELLVSPGDHPISEVMKRDVVTVPADMDQEQLSRIVSQHDLWALPVVDADGRMKGVVTIDDIVDVVREEATEDIHKLGGQEALDAPYLQTPLLSMLRKRGGWLAVLFVGELLTASAMSRYEAELARAMILALFIPLIISSGGNSGSQATTLVIRAMALGEVRLRDWWRIMRREVVAGLALGLILGTLGVIRVVTWEIMFHDYGPHHLLVGATVGVSLTCVVLWGTVTGSMLPFLLRAVGLDPASASAPLVATIVDVSGLAIYFTAAEVILSGTLL